MAINYNSLIGSETKLKEYFFNFIDFNYSLHKKAWSFIIDGKLNDEAIEILQHDEEISDTLEKDILDECVWIISKDQPRASHLRFIISIIYSAKDLERISDYALNIANALRNKTLNKDELKLLKKISNEYIGTMKKIIHLIKKENFSNYYQDSKNIKKDFALLYRDTMQEILKTSKKNNDSFNSLLSVMKSIDRTVDHIFNVFTNFKFVKNENKSITRNIELN